MTNTILTLHDISKQYGPIKAVDKLSLTIEKGNIYGFLGPNGSGKSTTLGMILQVVNPTSGSFSWFGGLPTHKALKRIGAIIERPNFYPYMSAEKNLALVCKIKNVPIHKIEEKLALVGLLERKKSAFKTYSLGMKQRLAIASALLNDPEVLILDEPTNGLDPQGIHQIREIILKIAAQGTTILLASHLLDEIEKICSHVVILNKGKNIYTGAVDKITNNNGYFILKSKQEKALIAYLKEHPNFTEIRCTNHKIKAVLQHPLSADALNQELFNNGIVLSHLSLEKQSLESQFLEITKR